MNQISGLVQSDGAGGEEAGPKTARGKRTWQKLLTAAEKEFGERGFHDAAITRITESAGVALGTFYVHFPSKEAIFRALVEHMGRLTRSFIAERVAGAPNRLAAERKGLEAFIAFVRAHRNLYRIVNEAQFVAPDAYRAYYEDFARAYRRRLADAAARGEIRKDADEALAWALIGASVFLGLRYGVWDDETPAARVAEAVAGLVERGLSAR